MESEHTKGILMRNLTYIVRFSRLTVKFPESLALFRLFYKQ